MRPRAGAASAAKLSRARASSAACEVRTTRHPFGTGMRASITWRMMPSRDDNVRTDVTANPVTVPCSRRRRLERDAVAALERRRKLDEQARRATTP